jgi:hypothetical protein
LIAPPLQEYDEAPVAERVAVFPEHSEMVAALKVPVVAAAVIVGVGFAVNVITWEFPQGFFPTTV